MVAFTLEVESETEQGLHKKVSNIKAVMWNRKPTVVQNLILRVGGGWSLVALKLCCNSDVNTASTQERTCLGYKVTCAKVSADGDVIIFHNTYAP